MTLRNQALLAAITGLVALIVIVFAVYSITDLLKPDARPGTHIPCLVSLPHCDEPANGIWSTR